VFYWECTHGSKVFFEYPIYGRLIRHKCKKSLLQRNIQNANRFEVKIPFFIEKDNFGCPICGKIFGTKVQLEDHIKQLKKYDLSHDNFYNNNFNSLYESNSNKKLNEFEDKKHYKPIFGKITIIKKKSSKI
jgi:hypothetical protein